MTLDQRAEAAARELVAATGVDVGRGLAGLRSTRRRRDAGRRAGLVLAAAVLVGATAWVAASPDDDRPEPAPAPGQVSNGALVGLDADGRTGGWRTLRGTAPAHLPDLFDNRAGLQFTSDGNHAVYVDTRGRALLLDLADGSSRFLATCPEEVCVPALSPDGTTLAWSGPPGLRLQEVGRDELDTVPLPEDIRGAGWPTWSPDGSSIAFLAADGVYVVRPDGSDLRLVQPLPGRTTVWRPVSFSPDGSRVAFLEGVPRPGGVDDLDWTVVTVSVDGSDEQRFFDAGACPCGGLPPPTLTWSPDGRYLAVAAGAGAPAPGLHVMRPDGTGDRLVAPTYLVQVAWQPVVE